MIFRRRRSSARSCSIRRRTVGSTTFARSSRRCTPRAGWSRWRRTFFRSRSWCRRATAALARGLANAGTLVKHARFFDTLRIEGTEAQVTKWIADADAKKMNLRRIDTKSIGIALDETTEIADVEAILNVFGAKGRAED